MIPSGTVLLVGLLLLQQAAAGLAQQPQQEPKPGDAMIERYLAQETAKLSQRVLDGAKTLEEWQARRPRLQREYLDMLGLWPLPERTPLHATITGTLERDDFVVDKLHFQSRPGLYVTGNLYRPKARSSASGGRQPPDKLPAVLYLCGHSGRGRNGNKTAFQDHGMWFASNGYICLVIDTLQWAEIPGVHHGTYGRPYPHLKSYGIKDRDVLENRLWWQALGYTPAGVECWNGIRAIDYLLSRPDVDAERIAVTGISGGGAATFWVAAADERVKCAVPVSGMSDLESYVTNKVINGHCDCMFLINTYHWEWTTIAALVAPRPMLFANSDKDSIFPMDGNRRVIERLRKLYALYGKPELVDDYVSPGGHAYRPDLRLAVFKWINKHMKNDTSPVKDSADFKLFPDQELRAFAEDKDIPKDAINDKIDETFVAKAQVKLPEAGKFDEWKTELLGKLRAGSFHGLPSQVPVATRSDRRPPEIWDRPHQTEAGVDVSIGLIQQSRNQPAPATLLVVNPKDIEGDKGPALEWVKWSQPYLGDGSGHFLLTRGVGTAWTSKSPPNTIERAHALLGRTVDEGRLLDTLMLFQTIRSQAGDAQPWRIIGRGQAGILAAYAALFEPSISEVVILDPPTSHREGPIFLNILRVLDIPEALGLLAPRPLTLVNAKDKAFDRTAEIYRLAGAEGKLQRK